MVMFSGLNLLWTEDLIFKVLTWIRAPLFDSACTYDESEKRLFLGEVQKIREMVGGQYKQLILHDVYLPEALTSISWKAVGDCLLNTYAKAVEENKAFVSIVWFSIKFKIDIPV